MNCGRMSGVLLMEEVLDIDSENVLVDIRPPLERRWSVRQNTEKTEDINLLNSCINRSFNGVQPRHNDVVDLNTTLSCDQKSIISSQFKYKACESAKECTKDFWDIFEEDDLDILSNQQICYSPLDIVIGAIQVALTTMLILMSMLLIAGINTSLLFLSRDTTDSNLKSIQQVILLLFYLLPSISFLPRSLHQLYRKGMHLSSFKVLAMILLGDCLHLSSYAVLLTQILPALDLICSLLLLAAVGVVPEMLKLLLLKTADENRKCTAVVSIQAVSLAYLFIANNTIDTRTVLSAAYVISSVTATHFLEDRLHRKAHGSCRHLNRILSFLFKIALCGVAMKPLINLESISLVQSIPNYITWSGGVLAFSSVLLKSACHLISRFKLRKVVSAFLPFTTPLLLVLLLLLGTVYSNDLCLLKQIDGTCSTGIRLCTYITTSRWVLTISALCWFWSYLTGVDVLLPHCITRCFIALNSVDIMTLKALSSKGRSNRSRTHKLTEIHELPISESNNKIGLDTMLQVEKKTPMMYLCATMWHENEAEMKQLVTSIFKLDHYQSVAHQTNELLSYMDSRLTNPDYFLFETHIVFDDAISCQGTGGKDGNEFVQRFTEAIQEAYAESVASNQWVTDLQTCRPTKSPTPYGGRIEYTLPGGNKMVVHLKDRQKIKTKKRWSMIQYLYYLLGYKLISENTDENCNLPSVRGHLPVSTKLAADNTFILMVDGDVSFEPESVKQLLDQIKMSPKTGVVCGRIRPMGSGLLVWYQRFEYALAHWLHKTAEHVMGVVLCTPGAFSLFKASALMDSNVIKTFAKQSESALDILRCEQGEDRWLCSLLYHQGYRCQYASTATAYTFAPESLAEFFNQRRRWSLSTIVHQFDMLVMWRRSYLMNRDMSLVYVIFEALIFVNTVLSGSYVILLQSYANLTVFGLNLELCYLISVFPPAVYAVSCHLISPTNQIRLASVLAVIYSGLMTAYLVGTLLSLVEMEHYNLLSVPLIFYCCVLMVTACLHPTELCDLLPCILYYLLMPTMFLTLMIYSVVNLNNVSWGTRMCANAGDQANSNSYKNRGQQRDDLINPWWAENPVFRDHKMEYLDEHEISFWKRLIGKYLSPAIKNPRDIDSLAQDLDSLRNKSALGYFTLNSVCLITCYLLQRSSLSQDAKSSEDSLEPIILICSAISGILIAIQFFCLLWKCVGSTMQNLSARLLLGSLPSKRTLESAKSVIHQIQQLKIKGGNQNGAGGKEYLSPATIISNLLTNSNHVERQSRARSIRLGRKPLDV